MLQEMQTDVQNQVIDILGAHVRDKILLRVKQAQFYTVIADEVTDCSNKEQLSLVLWYVNPGDCIIREDLVTFLECDSGITGQALAGKIVGFLRGSGLDPARLRGQAYDGAGNMAGKTNGVAALISSQYPLALYMHSLCFPLFESLSGEFTTVLQSKRAKLLIFLCKQIYCHKISQMLLF